MPKRARATAHARFAAWLDEAAGERAGEYDEIVGYHLEQAVRLRQEIGLRDDGDGRSLAEQAGTRLAAAGQQAFARGDVTAAVNLLRRAEPLLPPGAVERLDALITMGRALVRAGQLDAAHAALGQAVKKASSQGDRCREMRARVGLVDHALVAGVVSADRLESSLRESIAVLADVGDELGLTDAWYLLGQVKLDAGQALEGERAARQALEHARRSGRPHAAARPYLYVLVALKVGPTPVPEA